VKNTNAGCHLSIMDAQRSSAFGQQSQTYQAVLPLRPYGISWRSAGPRRAATRMRPVALGPQCLGPRWACPIRGPRALRARTQPPRRRRPTPEKCRCSGIESTPHCYQSPRRIPASKPAAQGTRKLIPRSDVVGGSRRCMCDGFPERGSQPARLNASEDRDAGDPPQG
jgi:hypothetical protein